MFAEYIDWRAEHPSDDLMTELLNAEFEDETGVDPDASPARRSSRYVNLLAGAGNETTTRLIGWTGKLLAEHPDQRRADRRGPVARPAGDRGDPPLRGAVAGPGPLRRHATSSTTDRRSPRAASWCCSTASANRDDRQFPDGDRFDIHRKIGHHLSFGYGIHFCLGAALARLEGRVALDEVLERFPDWEVDWDHAEQARTSTVRGWDSLPALVS